MTTTPDWADEEIDKCIDVACGLPHYRETMWDMIDDMKPLFAAALRKAKAAGLRQAAEIVLMAGVSDYNDRVRSFAQTAAATISIQASKQEAGN